MRTDLIPLPDLSDAEVENWRVLAHAALAPNPFFEPEYVLPLARGLGQETDVRLLVAREGEGWRGCLPVHTLRRWHRIPLRGIGTWRGHELYGLLGTPLVHSDGADETAATLLRAAAEAAPRAGFAAVDWVAEDGALGAIFSRALEERTLRSLRFERFERAAVVRRPKPTYVEETLSSKRRRELRRQARKLGEELGGEPELHERTDAGAIEDFVALEAAGRKGERGTVLAADPRHTRFFTDMCGEFAAAGRLQMLELRCGEQTVAAKCNLLAGNTIFMFKIAYEERWATFSPGILLELEMLKFFHDRTDAKEMDSCADPNNAMINRLWPDRRGISSFVLPARGPSGRLVRLTMDTARAMREREAGRSAKK